MKKEKLDPLYLYVEVNDLLSGSLNDVAYKIKNLENRLRTENEMVRQNPDMYIRFEMSLYSDRDGDLEVSLYGVRLETDKEFEQRVQQADRNRLAQEAAVKKRVENQKKKELETYLKLKDKYESK